MIVYPHPDIPGQYVAWERELDIYCFGTSREAALNKLANVVGDVWEKVAQGDMEAIDIILHDYRWGHV